MVESHVLRDLLGRSLVTVCYCSLSCAMEGLMLAKRLRSSQLRWCEIRLVTLAMRALVRYQGRQNNEHMIVAGTTAAPKAQCVCQKTDKKVWRPARKSGLRVTLGRMLALLRGYQPRGLYASGNHGNNCSCGVDKTRSPSSHSGQDRGDCRLSVSQQTGQVSGPHPDPHPKYTGMAYKARNGLLR